MVAPQKLIPIPPTLAAFPQPALEDADALPQPAPCWGDAIFAAPIDDDEDIEEDDDEPDDEEEDDEDDYEEDDDPEDVDDGIIIEEDDEEEEDDDEDEDDEEDADDEDDGTDSFEKLRTVSNPPQSRRSPTVRRR